MIAADLLGGACDAVGVDDVEGQRAHLAAVDRQGARRGDALRGVAGAEERGPAELGELADDLEAEASVGAGDEGDGGASEAAECSGEAPRPGGGRQRGGR